MRSPLLIVCTIGNYSTFRSEEVSDRSTLDKRRTQVRSERSRLVRGQETLSPTLLLVPKSDKETENNLKFRELNKGDVKGKGARVVVHVWTSSLRSTSRATMSTVYYVV